MIQTTSCFTLPRPPQNGPGLHEQRTTSKDDIYKLINLFNSFPYLISSIHPSPISTVATSITPALPARSPFGRSLSMDSVIASGGSESAPDSSHSATHLPRLASKASTDMAIDPRWNAELPEDKTLYFQSIASELDNTDVRFMPNPLTPSAVPMVGPARNVSDHEDAKPPAGRRSSMLKSRIKSSKTPPRALSSARQQSVTGSPMPRTLSASSISATTSAARRTAMPFPPVPGGSSSSSSGLDRQRSISLLASTAPNSQPPRIPLPPPLTMPAGFATAIPPSGTAPEPVDGDWIGIAFVGAKGSGKSVAIRKTIKHQNTRDHRRLRYNGYESM